MTGFKIAARLSREKGILPGSEFLAFGHVGFGGAHELSREATVEVRPLEDEEAERLFAEGETGMSPDAREEAGRRGWYVARPAPSP